MNYNIRTKLFAACCVLIAVSIAGCKKFVDVNTNPNNAVTTKAQYVFSGALATTFRNQVSTNAMIIPGAWVGHYGHSTSFTGGGSEKTYEFTNADFNVFDAMFDNLTDYEYVRKNAEKDGVGFWAEPANVMQCYVFGQLVSLYGDVPYTEAFAGTSNITPKYTDDQLIYDSLVIRLDSAISRMSRETWPTAGDVVAQDVYFQGNRDNWIRFANTVKLRLLMHQSFMGSRDAYITQQIATTANVGYINSNVLVSPGYQLIAGKLNPFYANFGYTALNVPTSDHRYRKMGAAVVNWLKTSNTTGTLVTSGNVAPTANADTFRLQSLSWPAGATVTAPSNTLSNYVGVPLGVGSGYSDAGASAIGPFQIQQGQGTRPGMLMLLSESLLMQAEAVQRGYMAGDAKALYEAGVLAHFRTCAAPSTAGNVSNTGDAFASRYLARIVQNVGWDSSPDKIRAILIQKWVSFTHINALEAWNDYRKSNGSGSLSTPSLPRTNAATSNPEPVRYLYPQSELDANSNNVPKGISRFTSRIFWDIN